MARVGSKPVLGSAWVLFSTPSSLTRTATTSATWGRGRLPVGHGTSRPSLRTGSRLDLPAPAVESQLQERTDSFVGLRSNHSAS
jgi:hypothetical protein